MTIDRRQFVGSTALLLGAPALAQRRQRKSAAPSHAGFTHGVASGEPGPDRMLFWTRCVGQNGVPVPLKLEVSLDPRMARSRIVAEATADPARDWTARTSVSGFSPGATYYYRWLGPDKTQSIIGRTKTLPPGSASQYRLGVFSCANMPFGWFNAYAHAVAADDIDLFVHLGDYIYEYGRGTYPDARHVVPGREIEPPGELITRADYWARYRSYRADPDLQALHAMHPSVTMWDDHEIANDAWIGGAGNHDPAREGSWISRVQAATAAYRDWLPVSDASWARYDIGRLATLYRLDTRLAGRDRQLDLGDALKGGGDPVTAMRTFRDEQWVEGSRQMLGRQQEKWLFDEMAAAARRGARWQVVAQQVVMGKLLLPPNAMQLAGPNPPQQVARSLTAGQYAAQVGLPFNMDSWDGYPAARARLLSTAQRNGVDLVVLSGDSHNAWANDLMNDGRPAGVEFAGQSVTSPGIEASIPAPPAQVAQALQQANPNLRFADTARRGYMQVTLNALEAVCEWRFTNPVTTRSNQLAATVRARTPALQRRLQLG